MESMQRDSPKGGPRGQGRGVTRCDVSPESPKTNELMTAVERQSNCVFAPARPGGAAIELQEGCQTASFFVFSPQVTQGYPGKTGDKAGSGRFVHGVDKSAAGSLRPIVLNPSFLADFVEISPLSMIWLIFGYMVRPPRIGCLKGPSGKGWKYCKKTSN